MSDTANRRKKNKLLRLGRAFAGNCPDRHVLRQGVTIQGCHDIKSQCGTRGVHACIQFVRLFPLLRSVGESCDIRAMSVPATGLSTLQCSLARSKCGGCPSFWSVVIWGEHCGDAKLGRFSHDPADMISDIVAGVSDAQLDLCSGWLYSAPWCSSPRSFSHTR